MRSPRGQASAEYVAVIALVGLVLASAAALTTGGVGDALLRGIRRGLCAVTGTGCPAPRPAAAARPDLPPCPVARELRTEELGGAAAIAKLALELGMRVERRSDGRVVIAFADTARAGLTAGVGAHVEAGPVRAGAVASVDGGLTFAAGREWLLRDAAAAERFLRRYGSNQELLGRAWRRVREHCPLCAVLTDDPPEPPEPDVRFEAGGASAGAHARAGAGALQATADAALAGALGRRLERGGGLTWYLRLDARAAVHAGLVAGLDGIAAGSAMAAYSTDRRGRPARLALSVAGRVVAGVGWRVPPGMRRALGRRAERGTAVEAESALDLADPASAVAARRLLAALGSGGPARIAGALAGLAARLRSSGATTVQTWRVRGDRTHAGAGAGAGARLDADYSLERSRQALTGVATRLPGLGFMPRADCLAV
ncbi:MAG: hypothetical protein U0T02_02955 [Solirubrobacteraceae bacterium]